MILHLLQIFLTEALTFMAYNFPLDSYDVTLIIYSLSLVLIRSQTLFSHSAFAADIA